MNNPKPVSTRFLTEVGMTPDKSVWCVVTQRKVGISASMNNDDIAGKCNALQTGQPLDHFLAHGFEQCIACAQERLAIRCLCCSADAKACERLKATVADPAPAIVLGVGQEIQHHCFVIAHERSQIGFVFHKS